MILISILASLSINAQEITGHWYGVLKGQGIQFRLVFNVIKIDKEYSLTIEIPDQGIKNILADKMTFENQKVIFEVSNLRVTDIEVLRLHYAKTLHHWLLRFQQNRQEIAQILGEEFCLMWEFYLAVSEVAFVFSDLVVYQFQLAKKHGPVPITRDYLHKE